MKEAITTDKAPAAIGPYSQAIKAGNTVYVSGQLPVDTQSDLRPEGITAQTEQSLKNAAAILAKEGLTLNDVVKTTVLLADINDFAAMNEVYKAHFTAPYPARSAFQVGTLPTGALVEIEVVAVKG